MKFQKMTSTMALASEVDTEGLGYGLRPIWPKRSPNQPQRVEWIATYRGQRISPDGSKWVARQACKAHHAAAIKRLKELEAAQKLSNVEKS